MFHVEQSHKMRQKRHSLTQHISNDYFEAIRALRSSNPVMVYVEGYEDIAFWREIFDKWEDKTKGRNFEITTPTRDDRAKGKKVVLSFAKQTGKNFLLCIDSDFDYLIDGANYQSEVIKNNKYIVHTRVYAIENLQCLPESLSSICAKATKNDKDIFDFEKFAKDYSKAVYPLFLWYYFGAVADSTHILTLAELKKTAALNYLAPQNNGAETIAFISRQVKRKTDSLEAKYPEILAQLPTIEKHLIEMGVKKDEVYLWIQGHFWKDNVVKIALGAVCNTLKQMVLSEIEASKLGDSHKRNELSAYNNSLRDVTSLLSDNTYYKQTEHCTYIDNEIGAIYIQ